LNSEIYEFESSNIYEYRFKSLGKRIITKVVQFAPLNIQGYYNLGFGDLLDNGLIDDNIESNNNDLKNNYEITSLLKIDGILVEIPFDLDDSKNYFGFFIKLNS
jgi:hypothetical protein